MILLFLSTSNNTSISILDTLLRNDLLEIWVLNPCNNKLHGFANSSDIMNVWATFSVSARDKQSLILFMFLRWKKQALHAYLVTCAHQQ